MTDRDKANTLFGGNNVTDVTRLDSMVTIEFTSLPPAFDPALLCAFWNPSVIELDAMVCPDDTCGDVHSGLRLHGCRL